MNMFVKLASVAALALAVSGAQASVITSAIIYENVPNPANAADPANQGAGLAAANFTVGALGINFNANGSAGQNTIAQFLNNPTFSNQVNGFNPNAAAQNMELFITGFITLNAGANNFVLGHDDGAVLTVAGFGTPLNAPGPTGLSLSPISLPNPGAAGDFAFTLEYVECCGFPANLDFSINNTVITQPPTVPEPSSIALLGTGFLAVAGAVRRRFTA